MVISGWILFLQGSSRGFSQQDPFIVRPSSILSVIHTWYLKLLQSSPRLLSANCILVFQEQGLVIMDHFCLDQWFKNNSKMKYLVNVPNVLKRNCNTSRSSPYQLSFDFSYKVRRKDSSNKL